MMAYRRKKEDFRRSELIELVAIKGGVVKKKIMPYGDAIDKKKAKGWKYWYFQVGFCTMKETP